MNVLAVVLTLLFLPVTALAQQALIDGKGRVVQVVPDGQTFQVAPSLQWRAAGPSVKAEWRYSAGTFTAPVVPGDSGMTAARANLIAAINAVLADPLVSQSIKEAFATLKRQYEIP